MKKIFLALTILCATTLSSCNHLLDIKPVNSMVPITIEDYQSLLVGGYPRTEYFMKTELMTDNIYVNFNSRNEPEKASEPWFLWASTHQLASSPLDSYWGTLYTSIFYANTVIDNFKTRSVNQAERELYETVLGEAYALRSHCYFYLANLYGETYSTDNLNKPCVPMPLTAENVNDYASNNTRETVAVVWGQVVADMNLAYELLKGKSSKGNFRFNYASLEALRSRVFLFMGNYAEASKSATSVITGRSLFNMNNLQKIIDKKGNSYAFGGDNGIMDEGYDQEILLYTGGKANWNMYYYDGNYFKPHEDLLSLCNRTEGRLDYRCYIFATFLDLSVKTNLESGKTTYRLYGNQAKQYWYTAYKLSEALLTRAECYLRHSPENMVLALEDLNTLLKKRIKSADYVALTLGDFADKDALLKRIFEERRLELAMEAGMRWLDLRRLGKPVIKHIYKLGEEYTLNQGDLRYVLQIPQSEIDNSPEMPLNPR